MNRIRTIQIRDNLYKIRYEVNENRPKFAYLSLRWDEPISLPSRFITNIKKGNVEKTVAEHHKISADDINRLMEDTDGSISGELIKKFEKSIDWHSLINNAPSKSDYRIAYKVCTNLTPLSDKQIDALSKYADWMTEVQIKTYLPHLLKL